MATATTGRSERGELRLSAACVAIEGAGGPALAASLDRGIALTVTDSNGSPCSGLGAEAFAVSTVANDRRNGSTANAVAVRGVSEPMPGVYVIALNAGLANHLHQPFACIVDIQTNARDGGQRAAGEPVSARVLVPMAP